MTPAFLLLKCPGGKEGAKQCPTQTSSYSSCVNDAVPLLLPCSLQEMEGAFSSVRQASEGAADTVLSCRCPHISQNSLSYFKIGANETT